MQSKTFFSSVLKATAFALILCLSGILVFAIVVKYAVLSDLTIKTVNQFIKIFSVFTACLFCVKKNAGILKGAICGTASTFLIYSVFAIISGNALFSLQMLADIAFMAIIGGVAGIISVNIGKD